MARIALTEEINEGYARSIPIKGFDSEALKAAKEIFAKYKQRGVVTSGEFEGTQWTLTDEANNYRLTLLSFGGGIRKAGMEWIGCTYRQYLTFVKMYLVFSLGEVCLSTIRGLLLLFNRLADSTEEEALSIRQFASHIPLFLKLIPGGDERRDAVIEELEEKIERRSGQETGKPRQLADFTTYLRFNELLTEFWGYASQKQRLFYFPLYFWWSLTSILPLRPTEFLLTPRECLKEQSGESLLRVRRTKLKGGNVRLHYSISEDYVLNEYTVTPKMAEELKWYLKQTADMPPTAVNTLLLNKPHFDYINRSMIAKNRYYTYGMLYACLNSFYKETSFLRDSPNTEIRIGDTRHLAMANLILSGGSPVICRELAGHASIEISSNYYANIANLVECVTLEKLRRTKSSQADISGKAVYPLSIPPKRLKVGDGWCTSENLNEGRVDDCLKTADNDGHIGECGNCLFFFSDNPGIRSKFMNAWEGKQQVDEDCRRLIRMIELVRKGMGYAEDIGAALLRLQHSANHYGNCLWEKYSEEGARVWQGPES